MAEKLEASEIMTAGALFFPNRVLDNALSSNKNLGDFMLEAKKKVETGVEFGSSRDRFLAMMKTSPEMLKELGMKNIRAHRIWRMTEEYLNWDGEDATELFGIGKYGSDSYRIFYKNEIPKNVQDKELKRYIKEELDV